MIEGTIGEEFLEDYFIESNIKYRTQVKITGLKGDDYNFRIADFYLPRLGIYVEYYGLYNKSKEERVRYDTKTEVYINNRKPTIFLMPEDLGIVDHVFHKKVKKLFSYNVYYNRWRYLRYSVNRFFLKGKPQFLVFAFLFYLLGLILGSEDFELQLAMGFRTFISIVFYLIALFVFLWPFAFKLPYLIDFSEVIRFFRHRG